MISEDVIRQRSYEIWQRRGCPDGLALENWLSAKAELEAEARAARFPSSECDCRRLVLPRPPISRPPLRSVSQRVANFNRPQAA